MSYSILKPVIPEPAIKEPVVQESTIEEPELEIQALPAVDSDSGYVDVEAPDTEEIDPPSTKPSRLFPRSIPRPLTSSLR